MLQHPSSLPWDFINRICLTLPRPNTLTYTPWTTSPFHRMRRGTHQSTHRTLPGTPAGSGSRTKMFRISPKPKVSLEIIQLMTNKPADKGKRTSPQLATQTRRSGGYSRLWIPWGCGTTLSLRCGATTVRGHKSCARVYQPNPTSITAPATQLTFGLHAASPCSSTHAFMHSLTHARTCQCSYSLVICYFSVTTACHTYIDISIHLIPEQ